MEGNSIDKKQDKGTVPKELENTVPVALSSGRSHYLEKKEKLLPEHSKIVSKEESDDRDRTNVGAKMMNLQQQQRCINNIDENRTKLLAIFPEEVWILVFDRVDNPEDLVTLTIASSVFKELLDPKTNAYLFPQVLQILAKGKHLTSQHCPALLNFRLVCKAWQHGVDRLLESRPSDNPEQHGNLQLLRTSQFLTSNIYYPLRFRLHNHYKLLKTIESELLSQITSSSLSSSFSPFPSRHLQIMEQVQGNRRIIFRVVGQGRRLELIISHPDRGVVLYFRAIVRQFLEKFGNHFWHAEIEANWCTNSLLFYKLMVRYSRSMPNLKSLYIKLPPTLRCGETSRINEGPPFPTLKHLQLLSVDNVSKDMLKIIFDANSHVKVLIVSHFREELVTERDCQVLRDLHTLSVSMSRDRILNWLYDQWKLQVMKLSIDGPHYYDDLNGDFDFATIFGKLESYQGTLTELHLQLPKAQRTGIEIFWLSSKRALRLPKLKRLEIVVRNICSFDFVLGLGSLELLSIHLDHNETFPRNTIRVDDEPTSSLNDLFCPGYLGIEFINRLWDAIPTLKIVKLKFGKKAACIYDRANRLA